MTLRTLSWTIDEAWARCRLDAFLAAQLHWRSRRWLVAQLHAGAVRVDGTPAKKAHRLGRGAKVELAVAEAAAPPDTLADVELRVLFEDDALVVVDKPAHLPVHPASTCMHRNLLARLQHRYRHELPDPDASVSIVHRLDRSTTGVIAFARRAALVPFFMGQFERRTVRKHYVALVHGVPPAHGRIDLRLLAAPAQRVVVDDAGKAACTVYERGQVHGDGDGAISWVRIALHTGRKHQIRVHLAAIGHPVVFDDLYGRTAERAAWPPEFGPQLHAARLELDHPDGRRLAFEAPIPAAMLDVASRPYSGLR